MTIYRENRRAVRHAITAYDLEWRSEPVKRTDGSGNPLPSLRKVHHVTLAGAYDERGYRWYQNCRMFLRGELVPGNSGRRYYAHFGGASDMVFLLKELVQLPDDYEIRGVFSGSSAILVRVKRGNNEWLFVDSFWTLRVPLRKIGEWLGEDMHKGHVDFETVSLAELKDYNEQDCRILYAALTRFQDAILERGGEMGITAASTAMRTFLRKYLARKIENSRDIDAYTRPAYTASRVEVIRKLCEVPAYYYDINSSFPYSMTFPCPGDMTGFHAGRWAPTLPDSETLWVADVELETGEDNYLPTVPYRSDSGRIFFPTGKMGGSKRPCRITSEDMKAGGFKVNRVNSWASFEDRDDLRGFAEEFYALRQMSGYEGAVFKIVLNSLYGKFAESELKEVLLVRPAHRDIFTQELLCPGVVVQEERAVIKHSHVPISTFITARSRRFELEVMREGAAKGDLFYGDTDSTITTAVLQTSKALGGLKLEYEIEGGLFVGPKLYGIQKKDWDALRYVSFSDGYFALEHEINRAKGFARVVGEGGESEPLDYETFARLAEGDAVTIERMLRIRELTRDGGVDYEPASVLMQKKISMSLRPKRCHLENGDSRPWTVEELENEDA